MNIISSIMSDPAGYLRNLLYSLPAILIALSFHEWGHAFAAYKLGDPTARNLGRMTINPLRHIDPLGFLMLILVRFGWAKPVPVNMSNFSKPRRDDIIVSLAGITTNLALAIVSTLAIYLFAVAGGKNVAVASILYYFLNINLGLMLFNIIPLPPLDGSHVAESLLIRKIGPKPFLWLARYGYIILIVLLVTGILSTVLSIAMNGIINGLATLFDGIFGYPGIAHVFAVMLGVL